jgi:hypothetical protein
VVATLQPDSGTQVDLSYVYQQIAASDTWTVHHGLGKKPAVSVIDTAGTQVYGEVEYVDLDTVQVSFSAPFSGECICN